jgi:ribose transport system ATP-binding protein
VAQEAVTSPGGPDPLGAMSGAPLIRVTGLCKAYGAFQALRDVAFDLLPGEVHVLFGENGAGKSTLIQVLCGVQPFDAGRYELFGEVVTAISPAEARRRGISVVFQEFSLIPEMTVEENLFLGHELTVGGRLAKAEMRRRVLAVLNRLGFDLAPDARVSQLRRAHQQMVEIAKALLLDCRVLVLDEPTASLTDHEAGQLFAIVEQLRAEGLGIIYVSHRMAEIDRLADRISVLRDGCHVATVQGDTVTHAALVELMTGRSFDKFYPEIARTPGETVLSLANVTLASGLCRDVSFAIRAGEVLGLAGLAGCGKSEVLRAVFGLEPLTGGRVEARGLPERHRPRDALAAGICYFPSDRSTEGLAMRQTLGANATMAALDHPRFSRAGALLRRRAERLFTTEVITRLRLRTPSATATAQALSGGNKQKLMLARGISRDFEVYLFDEPTVGVDVQAKLEIYGLIKSLAESGKAVVIASSELAEVLHLSHRLLVMREGEIVGELEGAGAREETVLSLFFAKAPVAAEVMQ